MNAIVVPELEVNGNSWVVTDPKSGRVYELYSRTNVEEIAAQGWRVETAAKYLGRINAEIRAAASR
jgi:hypothetical protein